MRLHPICPRDKKSRIPGGGVTATSANRHHSTLTGSCQVSAEYLAVGIRRRRADGFASKRVQPRTVSGQGRALLERGRRAWRTPQRRVGGNCVASSPEPAKPNGTAPSGH